MLIFGYLSLKVKAMDIRNILIRYWGYTSFRPPQEDIIRSVLEGKDTLALMPTGGGKSICFQVPAMAMEGVCIVVTPLIALMKDQVQNLSGRGIKAAAVYSGLHHHELEMAFDNCCYGDGKFLYVSPERLVTDQFRAALSRMKVCLLAVDEAHCISQWGYDFRPPYLRITEIRPMIPKVPVLALTATATPEVVKDIQLRLGFRQVNVFQKSFERKNLTYVVIREEDKLGRLIRIFARVAGTAIIYVRNRRRTEEVSAFLNKNRIKSTFYHAGLDMKVRESRQVSWMKEEHRVMVATNAFGMGIDKPNVRLIVHMDLPDSPEDYFQEAGRGGRDGKRSYAIILYHQADLAQASQNLAREFPLPDVIRNVYQSLGNQLQLAEGSGKDESFDLDLPALAKRTGQSTVVTFNALRFLEKEGYLRLDEAAGNPSRIFFHAGREELYRYQVENERMDRFIKILLRSYAGVFTGFTAINEQEIASRSGWSPAEVKEGLETLRKVGLMDYLPQHDKPQVVFALERADARKIRLSPEHYNERKKVASNKLQAMMDYVTGDAQCRSLFLLNYFGETGGARCGRCDICQNRNKIGLNDLEFDRVRQRIIELLTPAPLTLPEIVFQARGVGEEAVLKVIRWLEDHDLVRKDEQKRYHWQKQFKMKI